MWDESDTARSLGGGDRSSSGGGEVHLPERLREAFREEVDRTHQCLLNAAVAFTVTFTCSAP